MDTYKAKAVKLTGFTLSIIEDYRNLLISDSLNDNVKKYYKELSYDKLVSLAVMYCLSCTKS